ncbi:MAG: hypothetical protein MUF76_10145 [Hydrogenophaga sp.]|nr:hypothetical protein [Hydrogenophaga sp.]
MQSLVSWGLAAGLALALGLTCVVSMAAAPAGAQTAPAVALVVADNVPLRAAPQASAASNSLLWRGEWLEVRGERGDHLQVWDHHRERGGYVHREQLHPLGTAAADAPGLYALLAFVSEQPGAETLGLALAAAVVHALPAQQLNGPMEASVLDAVGRLAERLGARASRGAGSSARAQNTLTAHLDIAARQGVRFHSVAAGEAVVLCYDGEAHRRLLAHAHATPEQRARAALALTRPDCVAEPVRPAEREALDRQRDDWLSQVPADQLSPHWAARLQVRQAEVLSRLAFAAARRGDAVAAQAAARLSLDALAAVQPAELGESGLAQLRAAALRVNAVRWAAVPGAMEWPVGVPLRLENRPDGQTCVRLVETKAEKAARPDTAPERTLAERCTWGQVWPASAQRNRERNAIVLAVQPLDGWRELWVFRQTAQGWQVLVQPPAALLPGVGHAEFAGWVPGGQSFLLAREAEAEDRRIRRFEVVALDTLTPSRTALHADALGAFNRWADARWKRESLALR